MYTSVSFTEVTALIVASGADSGYNPRRAPYYRYNELYAIRKGWFKAHFITQDEYGPDVLQDLIDEANRYRESVDVKPSLLRRPSPRRITPVCKTPRFHCASGVTCGLAYASVT